MNAPEQVAFTDSWVDELVAYHQPTETAIGQITEIRSAAATFMKAICANCPPCADRAAAIRLAREAMMTANASIVLGGMV